MPRPEIDLLKGENFDEYKSPLSFKLGRNVIIAFCVIFSSLTIITAPLLIKIDGATLKTGRANIFKQIARLLINGDVELKGEKEDRINALFLGMGGAGHEGSFLTDTILLFSFKPSAKKASIISIPRDLWINIPGYGFRRINNAFALGELNSASQGGIELARQTIGPALGQPIHYVAAINFSGFKKIVDILGGIDVYVERNFSDPNYPTENFGVQMISFTQGLNHINGEEALKFARSRHGNNGEGSDFSRSKRQQKIILAIKDKLLRTGVLLNPNKISKIFNVLTKDIYTDVNLGEMRRFSEISRKIDKEQIALKSLDEESGLIVASKTEDGAYILIPKNGFNDFGEIKNLVANILNPESVGEQQISLKPNEAKAAENRTDLQATTLIIQNGTKINGLAKKTAEYILELGSYKIRSIGNAQKRDYEKTVIYDLSKGKKGEDLEILKDKLRANVGPFPDGASKEYQNQADFLIIVGKKNEFYTDGGSSG